MGALFECTYADRKGQEAIIRMGGNKKLVVIEGDEMVALQFALALQAKYALPLWIMDMDYSFNFCFDQHSNVLELRAAMASSLKQ